jgi:hypothetical protein
MTAAERLNNAIVQLEWVTPGTPPARKKMVGQLADHWTTWWNSTEGRAARSVPVANAPKLRRYAQWYARAWWMVGEKVRAGAPDPRTLDVGWAAAVSDQLSDLAEGAKAAKDAGENVADYVKARAKELRDELEKAQRKALTVIVVLGVVAAAVLLSFGYAKH